MSDDVQQGPRVPPQSQEPWGELEHEGCFFCDKPWDHYVNGADGTIYVCVDCYERRYGSAAKRNSTGKE